MNKTQKRMMISGISFVVFLLFIISLKTIDVTNLAPGVDIGWSTINIGFHDLLGMHMKIYKITEVFGIISFIPVAFFGLIGVLQFIQRKNPLKVDSTILCLGGTYVFLGILYVFFDKVVINYRPVLLEDETSLEASFPSSHTMLACVVLGTAIMTVDRYIKNDSLALIAKIACAVVGVIVVIGRLVCGVHWFTDILGGVIISFTIIMLYSGISEYYYQQYLKSKRPKRKKPNSQAPRRPRPNGGNPSGQPQPKPRPRPQKPVEE